jgi:hypothetical protein
MHSQQSTFSVIVSASSFELLDAAGAIVFSLGFGDYFGYGPSTPTPGLIFNHLDALVTDSRLVWSTRPPAPVAGTASINFAGPKLVTNTSGQPPNLSLGVDARSAAYLSGGAISIGNPAPTLSLETVIATGNTNVDITAPDTVTGSNRARLQLGSLFGALLRSSINATTEIVDSLGLPTGGRITADTSGIDLDPGAGRRLRLNGRAGLLPLSVQQYNLPASLNVPYRSFLMNGINPPNAGVVGDIYTITATCRVLCVVPAGAFLFEYQGFGGGAGISAQRGVATQWVANHDATLSATWVFEQTIAGGITWTIVGGSTGGTWNLIAPDTMFVVTHYGIR